MTEAQVWELPIPEVTLEELFQAIGANYSKRLPRSNTLEIYRQVLVEAATLIQPKMVWRQVGISEISEGAVGLTSGHQLTSRLVAKVASRVQRMILFALTVGEVIDQRIDTYQKSGKMLEAFSLDAAASVLVAKSGALAVAKITEIARAEGLDVTFPLGPGHSYWPGLEDIRQIFEILKPERVGMTLTPSYLMMPRKSIAMLIGVGSELAEFQGKTHCDFCDLQSTCRMRNIGREC